MTPDPNRQWFVYYKDKEMGPFSEADVHAKLKNKELDNSAYLFTEGMSDWALVDEIPVLAPPAAPAPAAPVTPAATFTPSAEKSAPAQQKETIGVAASTKKATQKSEPTAQVPKSEAAPAAAPAKKPAIRRGVLYTLLGAVVIIAGISKYLDMASTPTPNETKPTAKLANPALAPSATQTPATGQSTLEATRPATKTFDWSELADFRKNQDPKGPPFRIANRVLADSHPVIMGVLSPLIRSNSLRVAIYPDNERNLMPVGKIWRLNVEVIDGYFSVGPLNIEGAELPPGRYHVMLASHEGFLGEVNFEVGTWPTPEKVNEIQLALQKERSSLAEKERGVIETKLREVAGAIEQLKLYGRSATMGPRGLKEWQRGSQPWRATLLKALDEQRGVMSGPMFYGDVESKIYNLMFESLKMQEALDIYSKGGAKALQSAKKKNLGQLWTELSSLQSSVEGEVRILGQTAVGPLKLDPEVVKRQLLETK
ncbi:MAG: DUF4339 domain-containing protein [Bdellovibrionales bacterium]|nr:DUF4339 domain-containing protein [Bdellovibrionales bacterium]